MDAIIVIAIIWFVIGVIGKGLKAANQSGQKSRPGQAPPGGARPRPPYPPLTPTARPGGEAAPNWGDIMSMFGGAPAQTREAPDMEGVSTESTGPDGSLTGPSIMDSSARMMDGSQPDYEGASLPDETPVTSSLRPETPVAPMLRPDARPRKYDPADMRSAVVWAEILAKPKSLRRVAR